MIKKNSGFYSSRPRLMDVPVNYSIGSVTGLILLFTMIIVKIPAFFIDTLLCIYILFSLHLLCSCFSFSPSRRLYPESIFLWAGLGGGLIMSLFRAIVTDGHRGACGTGHVIVAAGEISMGGDLIVGLILSIFSVWMCLRTVRDLFFITETINYFFMEEGPCRLTEISPYEEALFYSNLKRSLMYFQGTVIGIPIIFFMSVTGGIIYGITRQGMTAADALVQYSILSAGMILMFSLLNFAVSVILKNSFSACQPPHYFRNSENYSERVAGQFMSIGGISLLLYLTGVNHIIPLPPVPFMFISFLFIILSFAVVREHTDKSNFFSMLLRVIFMVTAVTFLISAGVKINDNYEGFRMVQMYSMGLSAEDTDDIKLELNKMGYSDGVEFKIVRGEKSSVIYAEKRFKYKILSHLADKGLPRMGNKRNKGEVNVEALERELEATIIRIEGIKNVKIKIVPREESLFESDTQPAKATVLLDLKEGYTLSDTQLLAVIALLTGAVADLKPSDVQIVDARGVKLSDIININNSRAEKKLEGSIMKMKGVDRAKVMLTTSEGYEKSVIVMLRLDEGYRMSKTEIKSIIGLTGASVAGFKEENLQIVDTSGKILFKSNSHMESKLEEAILKLEGIENVKVMLSEEHGIVKATVMVKAKDTSEVSKSQTEEIKHLLVKSIEGLKSENVKFFDTGRL